jgi:hypothetical protein
VGLETDVSKCKKTFIPIWSCGTIFVDKRCVVLGVLDAIYLESFFLKPKTEVKKSEVSVKTNFGFFGASFQVKDGTLAIFSFLGVFFGADME